MKTSFLLSFALAALAVSTTMQAKTIAYPKLHPLFTVDIPSGWQVHYDGEGPLMIQTPDASVVVVFDGRLRGVDDSATAKKAVGVQIKATAKTTGFTDFREIAGVQEMQLSEGITAMGAKYHAKFPSGEPCIYTVAIFSPNGSDYCSAEVSVKARALIGEVDDKRQALLDSIKAVDDNEDEANDDDEG